MVRIVFFFILTAAAVFAALTLSDYPGVVRVEWLGRIIELPIGIGIAGIIAVALLGAVAFWLFRALWRTPGAIGQHLDKRRTNKGYQALSSGMVAVAAGDADEARRHANKAHRLLSRQPLTRLLSAQAAQLNGNEKAAQNYFEAMLDDPQTEFLGVRGLLTLAAKEGKRPKVLNLAKRALALKPESPWAQTTAFEAQVNSHLWEEAQTTLQRAVAKKVVEKADSNKLKAALLVERSRAVLTDGDLDEALRLAGQARRADPASRAAALCLARRQLEAGKERAAKSTIEKAWSTMPSGQLAMLYADIGPADEKPEQLLTRMKRLARSNPDHVESLLAVASAQIGTGEYDAAREALLRVETVEPSQRVYRLLAHLDRESGNPQLVDGWLARANRAPEARAEIGIDPASAPERVWASAPGWRGSEIEAGAGPAPAGAQTVFASYEGKVPPLSVPTRPITHQTDRVEVVPAENPPLAEASAGGLPKPRRPEAEIIPADRAEPIETNSGVDLHPGPVTDVDLTDANVSEAGAPRQESVETNSGVDLRPSPKPTPAVQKQEPVETNGPVDLHGHNGSKTNGAGDNTSADSQSADRNWLKRPSRSIGTPPATGNGPSSDERKNWLSRPNRSI